MSLFNKVMHEADEIRQHFFDLLNHALPRLSMYGDELTAILFLEILAFIDEREIEMKHHFDALTKRGAADSSTRVSGAFKKMTSQATDKEIASVYAEITFQMGYLDVGRLLSESELASLRSRLRYCRDNALTTTEVINRFGDPSWLSGANPG